MRLAKNLRTKQTYLVAGMCKLAGSLLANFEVIKTMTNPPIGVC